MGGRSCSSQPYSSDIMQGASGQPRHRRNVGQASNLTVGGSPVPEFGQWNKNPEQADGYCDVFNQVITDRRTSSREFNEPKFGMPYDGEHQMIQMDLDTFPAQGIKLNPPPVIKARTGGQSAVPWDDDAIFSGPLLGNTENASGKHRDRPTASPAQIESKLPMPGSTREVVTIPNEPQMDQDVGPSQAICSMNAAVKSTGGAPIEHFPQHRSTTYPAPHWAESGTGSIGYKTMDKLKQRVCDVVSHKKNIWVLQTRIQVLMEEVAQVQTLLMSGESDSKDEAAQVRQWFADAEEILKEANSILESRNNMADKKRLCSTCWDPTSAWETGEMVRDIDKILEGKNSLNLSSYFCGLSYCNKLKSRESKLQEILEALMDIHINMIGIYGMVGVGKTMLAKELARHAEDNPLFDATVMVQVSESVDIKLIQSQIANKLGLQLSEADDEDARAHFLYNALEEKVTERCQESDMKLVQQSNVLVILDGMQHTIDLGAVGVPYGQDGTARCKVVLISRNADVCKKMGAEKQFLLDCLSLDEGRILFQERLRGKIESMEIPPERYQCLENVFLVKCRGLPLLINSLACALRDMSWSDWEIAVDQMDRHTLVEVDGLKQVSDKILELCNNFIHNGERHKLFLLCCLVQQGMDISVARLMRYGIGFGLFGDNSLAYVVDQINSWVDELKSLSLLLESKEPHHLMVHNIVQDVAISSLSQGNYILPVLLDVGTHWPTRESYESCAAISFTPDSNYKCVNGLELNKLQVCLLKGKPSVSLPDHFFQGMQSLKILDISGITFLDFPSSIGDLKNLVTLHMECCEIKCEFMSTISNLTELEVLSLRDSNVEALTEEIANLTNIRVLDLTHCKNLGTFCVGAVAKLDRLRELYLYDSYRDWNSDDMKKFKSLPLEVLEIIISEDCQMPINSINITNLRRFVIHIGRFFNMPQDDYSSFSRVLLISDDDGLQLQESGIRDLLPWTEFLLIDRVSGLLNGLGDLNIHGFLHLKDLHLQMCSGVKCILDTSKLSMIQRDVFPELETLILTKLSDLKSICRWLPHHNFFPKLRELRLMGLNLLQPCVLPIQFAVTLEVMEVSDCASSIYIFLTSEINGANSIVELPCMKKLELKGLTNLLALQHWSDALITRDEYVLFDAKIVFPSLKEMHLEGLDQIKYLWDLSGSKEYGTELLQRQTRDKNPYEGSLCFANLKYMTISHCNKLESLLSSSIANSLLQLEKLEVESCVSMLEVITSDMEDDVNPTTMIIFPKLQTLRLKSLKILECFYRGRLLLKFPMLRELDLFRLSEMKAFTLKNSQSVQTESTVLFDGEIEFASLEQLQVSSMGIELIKRHGDMRIFPNLSRLTLENLINLKSLPNINSKTLRFLDLRYVECFKVLVSTQTTYMPCIRSCILSQELEELILSESDCVEELIDDEKSVDNCNENDNKWFVSLRRLELLRLTHLKNIPWNMLTNLRSIQIRELFGWTSLMSTTLFARGNGLPLLEDIRVGFCNKLEAIISKELQEDQDSVKYGITVFPSLRHIHLESLPRFRSFSLGSYEAHFPSLETVEIRRCYGLQSFSLGPLRTPRLKSVNLESKTMEANTLDDFISLKMAVRAAILDEVKAPAEQLGVMPSSFRGVASMRGRGKKWREEDLSCSSLPGLM